MVALVEYREARMSTPRQTFRFVMTCSHAKAVFVVGDFNDWRTTATPMRYTHENIWEADIDLPANEHRFSYFVIDDRWQAGHAPFGGTFLLPGSWAAVTRASCVPAAAAPSQSL